MPNPTDEVKAYLSKIGKKGGSVSKNVGNKHALKYKTDEERREARKRQQAEWRERQKKKQEQTK